MYGRLQRLPDLAASEPEKVTDFLPGNVTYDAPTKTLTHSYRFGEQASTKLSELNIGPVSLLAADVRPWGERAR